MNQKPFKIIAKSALVVLGTLVCAVVAFLFSRGGILRNQVIHQPASQVEAVGNPEDGAPCDAAKVDGDIYQGRRLEIDVPDLGINQKAKIDVAEEYNRTCMKNAFTENELHGGFHTATIQYDVNDLTNSWATMERALELGAPEGVENMKEGFELMEIAVWDGDIETNPHAADDFPFSCNTMYSRRREGRRNDKQPRVQDRASLGSYCCANGWGTEEYLYNPAEAYINEGYDEFDGGFKNWFENSPEPDADGDPRNGYSGTMTGHYTLRWERTTQEVDVTFEKIPATHMQKNFTFSLPWPGLLYKHLTPPGVGDLNFYAAKGSMEDTQKGNGVWDGANAPAGNCSAAGAVPLPSKEWDNDKDGKDWVEPTAYPCPPGTPMYDASGHFAWYHDEPFVDENNNGKYDEVEPFQDTGNGYGPSNESGGSDVWTYDAGSGSIDQTVAPELTFNRQIIEIADTPSPKSNGLPYAPITKFYPLTNIHIRGVFEAYTQTECNCRPDDREETGVSAQGEEFHGCQATFGDFFDPAQCGFCGANQPILGVAADGSLYTKGYQQTYCEDSIPRATNVRWPPFNFNTVNFLWELSSASIGEIFDSVLKDTGSLPSVDITTAPASPQKGDSVNVLAVPLSFFQKPQDMYFAWTINGFTQQGLVAGAEDRIKDHKAPPDFVDRPSSGAPVLDKETRQFFFAPKRVTERDANGDGMDDTWEMRYFGTLDVKPFTDPDNDRFVPKDFANSKPSALSDSPDQQTKRSNEAEGRFIYITPGVWWTKNGKDTFIPPADFNPEWFPEPDIAPGLSNIEEYVWGTNPIDPDSDDDGFPDGADLVGVGQLQWSYVNNVGPLDANRDKIGVIVMGKGNAASQQTAQPLTQIVCVDKTVYPSANNNLGLSVNFDPSIPAPGEELKLQAVTKNSDIKEGFLTYDWKVNGVDKVIGGQGKNELTLTKDDTKNLVSGEILKVEVTAYNNNSIQGSYGAVGTAMANVPVGVAYDSLEVRQHDQVVFPYPSEQITDASRVSALAAQLKNGISINRTDDVTISLLNIWSNEITNNLYFEWKVDNQTQNGKDPGKGSGKGSGYTNFTFNPQSFLPNGLTEEDIMPKTIEVVGRAVDVNTQKETFNINLVFNYNQPGISISEDGEGGSAIALSADMPQLASSENLFYNWKVDGKTISEGKGNSKIHLSYLQASTAPIVKLTISNIGGVVTHEVSASTTVNLSRLSLTLKQRIAYSIYGFFKDIPKSTKNVFTGFLLANAVFLVLFGLYSLNRGRGYEPKS